MNTASYFGGSTTILSPFTYSITFPSRVHTTTNYSLGYSIKQIGYSMANNKLNFTLEPRVRTATSTSMYFYTNNANKISRLILAYIIIEPLFGIYNFRTYWMKPKANIVNG